MIWEPITGQASGHAVFSQGTRRAWKLKLASEDDFILLQREIEHQTVTNKNVVYWDAVNHMRQLAESRTKAKSEAAA